MLLPFIFASTSLLSAFPGGPAMTTTTVDTGNDHRVTVAVALSRVEGEVPVPVRITGSDIDVEATICDGPACTAGRRVVVPANGWIDELVVVDDGRPRLRFTNATAKPAFVTCCDASQAMGRVVAVVGDALPSQEVSTFQTGNAVVYALAVGRLLDEHPEQLGNVGGVLLRDGDLDHDSAFFAQLRRFAQLGGLVSVDEAQAERLALGPATTMEALHSRDLAVAYQSGSPENVDIAVDEGRRIRSFPIEPSRVPTIRGRLHVVDTGLVIVREPGVDPLDGVADLVRARHRFVYARGHDWRSTGEFTNALLVGLQPQPSPLPMLAWFIVTFGVAVVVARIVVKRRTAMDGPVAAVGAVVAVLTLSGAVAVGVGVSSSSWRTTVVRVVGPGAVVRTTNLVSARSPDFNVDITAFKTGLDGGRRTFIADGYSLDGRRTHFGAGVAEVTVERTVDEGPGRILVAGTSTTNGFPHAVDLHSRAGLSLHVEAGAVVGEYDWDVASRRDEVVSQQINRLIDVVQQRCSCAVASFVADDGVMTIVEGTIQ